MKLRLHYLLFAGFFLCLIQVNAQVGIGTPMPNSSAQLEVAAQDKGILIPRVALSSVFDTETISSGNAESLLVFNTTNSIDIKPGYYYWFEGSWNRIVSAQDVSKENSIDNVVVFDSVSEEFHYIDNTGATVTIDLEGLVKFKETLTTLIQNADGTYSYYNEASIDADGMPISGSGLVIDIPGSVVGEFQAIINDHVVKQQILEAIENSYVGGNVYFDGSSFTYTTKEGGNTVVSIQDIITTNETKTTIADNGDGTYTYTNEGGEQVVIDANTTAVTENNGVYTFTDSNGTEITAIDTNANAITFNGTVSGLLSTNVQDAIEEIKTKLDGTTDVLVDNEDGTYSHTTVDGTPVTINANTTKVSVVDGVYTFTDGAGTTITTIDTNVSAAVVSLDNSTNDLVAANVQEGIDEVAALIKSGAGVTLVDNNDGTVSLNAADGTELAVVYKTQVTDHDDGTYTIDNGDSKPITIDTNASAIIFDGVASGLLSTNVQDAVVEIKTKLDGTTDALVDNGDGTYSHTTIDGKLVTFDVNATTVELVDDVYTFKDSNGATITTIDTNAGALAFDNNTNEFTSTNVQDALEEIQANLDGTTDDLTYNDDGTYTHIAVDGTPIIIDANTTSVEITDGVYVFRDGAGTTITTIDTNISADAVTFVSGESGLSSTNVQNAIKEIKSQLDGTTDLLVDNEDGTFTYTAAGHTPVDFDANTTSVKITDGVYVFKDGAGTTITTIDTNASAIIFDGIASGLSSTNVQNAIKEIKTQLDGTTDILVDNEDGTYTHTTAAGGDPVIIDANTTSVQITDGVYVFKDGAGTTITTIDTNVSADAVTFVSGESGLSSTNVQNAIKEIKTQLDGTTDILVDNEDGTYTHTTAAGGAPVIIDANTTSVQITDGVYVFKDGAGTTITTIDTNVSADAVTFVSGDSGLSSANVQDAIVEIKTKLDGTTDILVDNEDGTYTHTAAAGGDPVIIDANTTSVEITDGVYVFKDGAGTIITTIDTNVSADAVRFVSGESGLSSANVQDAIVEIKSQLDGTTDLLVDNEDGTFTYTAAGHTPVDFDANTTSVKITDGVYTFTDVAGTIITTIDTNASAIIFDGIASGLSSTNVQEAIKEIKSQLDGTSDILVDNEDGTYTHTAAAGGAPVIIDANTTSVEITDGVYTFTDGTGTTITTIDTNVRADAVTFVSGESGLSSTNVQDAIVEIKTKLDGTTNSLVDNEDGTFIYTAAGESPVSFSANTTKVTESEGVYVFKDGTGTTITTIDTNVSADAVTFVSGESGLSSTNVQNAIKEIKTQLDGTTDILVDNEDGTYTHTAAAGGTPITIDANTTSVEITDGVYTFKDGAGTTITTIDTNVSADAVTFVSGESGLLSTNVQSAIKEIKTQLDGTSDILIDNYDGTYTHTTADGDPATINTNTTSVEITDGVYTFKDGAGNEITAIDTNADALDFDSSTNGFSSTNVQDALEEIQANLVNTTDDLTYNDDGTYTHIAVDGTPITIDANTTSVEITDGVYVFRDGAGTTITTIDTNASAIIFDGVDSGLNATNVQDALEEIQAKLDNTTDGLVDNGDGTYTHTAVNGTPITIDANTTKVSVVDGVYVFIDGVGNEITTIDTNVSADAVTFVSGESGLLSTNVQDAIVEIKTKLDGTTNSLVDEGDGTFIYTAAGESPVLFSANTTKVTESEGVYVFKDGAGNEITTIDTNVSADAVTFVSGESGLSSTNVQGAIEELKSQLDLTSDGMVDNKNGTFTHTAVDGTAVIIDANTTNVSVVDGVYTFTDGAGNTVTTIDTNAGATGYDNTTSGLTSDKVQDAIDEIVNNIDSGAGVTLVDNTDGTVSLTADDGTVLGTVDKTEVIDNGDGTYTLDSGYGTPVTIDTNADALAFDNSENGFTSTNVQDALEEIQANLDNTTDVLVDNGDGTYTHTAVDGTPIIIDANTTNVSVVDGVYTFTDGAGNTVTTIDTNASATGYDNTTSDLTSDNVQGAIDELSQTIETNKGDLTVSDGIEFTGATDGINKLLSDAGIGVADGGVTTAKVGADAITNDKLADNAVQTENILDGTVETADLANGAVSPGKMTPGTINQTMITNAAGDVEWIDNTTLVAGNETLTTLVDNEDGTFTYTDENGITTIIIKTAVIDNNDGTFTLVSGNETPVTIDTNANALTFDISTNDFTSTNVQEALEEIQGNLDNTTDVLVDNGDGTYTHTAVDGTVVIIDANTTKVSVVDGVYTFADGTENTVTTIDTNADAIAYDNTTSGLTSENAKDAIDELSHTIATNKGDLTVSDGIEFTTGTDGINKLLADAGIGIADGGVTTAKLANSAVTSDKVDPDAITNDKLADNAVQTENIVDGTIATIDLADNAVTNDKLADNAVSTENIVDGTVGPKDLNSTVAGDGLSKDSESGVINVNAANGLSIANDSIQLGGTLNEPTVISTSEVNTLSLEGLQTGTHTDDIVVTGADGTLKQVKSVMPKFFYMPSIVFDVTTPGEYTKELYQLYLDQYGTPMVSSSGSSGTIPTLEATDLEYYITYYDDTLFNDVSIDANGKVTYTVNPSAVTPASFMNIVFVVK